MTMTHRLLTMITMVVALMMVALVPGDGDGDDDDAADQGCISCGILGYEHVE